MESEDERLARRLQEEEERLAHIEDERYYRQGLEPNGSFGNGSYNRGSPYSSTTAGNSGGGGMGGHQRGGSGSGGGADREREDRLAYARRLQEEAFQRVHASSQPKTTEESDLELAMRMQIAENEPPPTDDEDEDLKLAKFMEESGMSIRDIDEDGIQAIKHKGLGALSGLGVHSPPAPGRGLPSSLGLGGGGRGARGGGLYGRHIDEGSEHEENSYEFGLFGNDGSGGGRSRTGRGGQTRPAGIPSSIPAGIPSSIPPPARSSPSPRPSPSPRSSPKPSSTPAGSRSVPQPSSIPPAAIPSAIPSAIPPASSVPSHSSIPGKTSPSTTSPRRMQASPLQRASPSVRQIPSRPMDTSSGRMAASSPGEFHRRVPSSSKSGGPGSPIATMDASDGQRTRRLPGISKSFGKARSSADLFTRSTPARTRSTDSAHALRGDHDDHGNPTLRRGGRRPNSRGRNADPELGAPPMMTDLPPGVNLGSANDPDALLLDTPAGGNAPEGHGKKEKKKGKFLKKIFGGGGNKNSNKHSFPNVEDIPDAIPAAIPAPPVDTEAGPLPHSVSVNRSIADNALRKSITAAEKKPTSICTVCGGRSGKMLVAIDRKFHVDCFRCMSCNEVIDPTTVFAVSVDPMGEQQPLHRKCYAEFYGVHCAVCKHAIPANDDGSVSFIKHPFFSTEQMCPRHADETGRRRCTGCHRFEPEDEPFADLNDGGRCVCYSCCRTVVMNNEDVKPLWQKVITFFEFQLGLPVWEEMRDIPILCVGQEALNENQLKDGTSAHGDSSQIMTRGLCLSEHDGNTSFRVPSLRYNESLSNFEACNHSGFFDVDVANLKGNAHSEVMAILCLSGLPCDLTASVLAHEATHAWIKLHPKFKVRRSLPAQVEEGCAQLVAYLFLAEGLEPPKRNSGIGPSDEKLRQYFKFSIETDDNEIYGEGYRRAAMAYSAIGILDLLEHVVRFQEFPNVAGSDLH